MFSKFCDSTFLSSITILFCAVECISGQLLEHQNISEEIQYSPAFINADIIYIGYPKRDSSENHDLLQADFQIAYLPMDTFSLNFMDLNLVDFKPSILVLLPGNLTEFTNLILQLSDLIKYGYPKAKLSTLMKWPHVIVSENDNLTNLDRLIDDVNASSFSLKDDVFILYDIQNENNNSYILAHEIFMIKNISFVQTVPLKGDIEAGSYSFSITSQRRMNFMGAHIRATAVDSITDAPVVTYSNSSDNETIEFIGGLGVFDFWDISEILNFSVIAIKSYEDISEEDGNIMGIGKQLIDDVADISILHSYTLTQYVRHLTALLPLGGDRILAFFKQPPSSSVRNIFIKPFTSSLWTTLGLVWSTVTVCIFIFGYFEHRTKQEGQWPLVETVPWAISIFAQKSYYVSPTTIPMRIIFISSFYMSIVVYTSYSAAIVSSLTAEIVPINSILDLLKHDFTLISDPHVFYSYFLAKESTSRKDYTALLTANHVNDVEDVRKVGLGGSMFLNTMDTLCLSAAELGYSNQEICRVFSYVPIGQVVLTSGFYVNKGSPFKEPFNLKLVVIMERGLNKRYIKNYYDQTLVKCPKKKTSYREDLEINDVFTAFAILGVGWLVSIVIMIIENVVVLGIKYCLPS